MEEEGHILMFINLLCLVQIRANCKGPKVEVGSLWHYKSAEHSYYVSKIHFLLYKHYFLLPQFWFNLLCILSCFACFACWDKPHQVQKVCDWNRNLFALKSKNWLFSFSHLFLQRLNVMEHYMWTVCSILYSVLVNMVSTCHFSSCPHPSTDL